MKLEARRVLALVLAVALCLGLTACGNKDGSGQEASDQTVNTVASELGYGYLSEYQDLAVDINWINSVSSAGGMLYFSGEYYDESTYTSTTKLYCMDPATGSVTEVPLPELVNTDGVSEYVQQISVCPDGSGYWMIYEHYEYQPMEVEDEYGVMPAVEETSDEGLSGEYEVDLLSAVALPAEPVTEEEPALDEPAEMGEGDIVDDMMIYEEPQTQSWAKKMDMSGNELLAIDLTAATSELSYFYPSAVAQNDQGDLFIACDDRILIFGSDGTQKAPVIMENQWVQYMVATGNGTVVASFYDPESLGMVVCKLENGTFSAPLNLEGVPEAGNMMIYPGDGDTVLLNDGSLLYSVDVNTGVATKLLSWLDSDINGTNLNGIAASGADTIAVMIANYRNEVTYELGILTKTPADQLPKRTILTLGAEYLDSVLQDAVIKFNRTNDTYRVTLVDYSSYNTNEDYTLAGKQLDRDVISGNCPDIIYLSTGHQDKYIAKGVLADLTALMDQDTELKPEDLLAGPLQAYVSDGKLYGIPSSFSLQSMLVSRQLAGDRDSWTMAEMGEIVRGLEDDAMVMNYASQESFLSQMIYQNMSLFVDYGAAKCDFSGETFKELLTMAAELPTEEELMAMQEEQMEAMENGTFMFMDDYQMVQNGQLLMVNHWMSDAYSVKYFYNLYSRDNGFLALGYPQSAGNGMLLSVDSALALSARSKNLDGAWSFLKSTLSEENQKNVWSFPITVKAFDEKMAEAMEQPFYMDGDEKVHYDETGWIGETEYPIVPLTQQQIDDFKVMINGAVCSGSYDEDILNIVSEEAGAFFSGDKSAEEVADLIQNRVTIYLGETS